MPGRRVGDRPSHKYVNTYLGKDDEEKERIGTMDERKCFSDVMLGLEDK